MNLKPCIVAVTLVLLLLFLSVPVYSDPVVNDDNTRDHIVLEYWCPTCYSFASNKSADSVQSDSVQSDPVQSDPVQSDPVQSQPETPTYQVRAGDTLYQISKKYGVTVSDLMLMNQIDNPKRLRIGQILNIPAARKGGANPLSKQNPYIKKVLTSTLTAYTAGVESTGKRSWDPGYGITSSGKKAKEGHTIAVDPKVIPIGSTVYIEGIGIRKAEDTGSAIRGAKIDIFMNDVRRAIEFGVKKNVKVYVLANPV